MIAKVQNLSLARANTIGPKKDVAVPSKEEKNVIVSGTEKKSNFNWKGKPAIAMYGAGVLLLGVAAYKLAKGKKPVKEGEKLKELAETATENVKVTGVVEKNLAKVKEEVLEKVIEKAAETKETIKDVAEKVTEKATEVKATVKEVVEQVTEKVTQKATEPKGAVKEVVEQAAEKTSEKAIVVEDTVKTIAGKMSLEKFRETGHIFDGGRAKTKNGLNFSGVIEHVKKDASKMEYTYEDGLITKSTKDGELFKLYERVQEPADITLTKIGVFDKAKKEGRVLMLRRDFVDSPRDRFIERYTEHVLKDTDKTIDEILVGAKKLNKNTSYETTNVYRVCTEVYEIVKGKWKLLSRIPEKVAEKDPFNY